MPSGIAHTRVMHVAYSYNVRGIDCISERTLLGTPGKGYSEYSLRLQNTIHCEFAASFQKISCSRSTKL